MPVVSRIVPQSTSSSVSSKSSKRPQTAYQLAAAAVLAAAKEHGLTTSGWLKTNPQDSCRKTKLTDASGAFVGYGYCGPSGTWWLSRGKYAHGQIIAEGKATEPEAPITPAATVLCTAVVGNRHETGLVAA